MSAFADEQDLTTVWFLSFGEKRQTHKWQNPRMNLALYIMSAAISILLYLYMVSKNFISSSLLVVTEVEGGSILCAEYGRTCKSPTRCVRRIAHRVSISGGAARSEAHLDGDVLTSCCCIISDGSCVKCRQHCSRREQTILRCDAPQKTLTGCHLAARAVAEVQNLTHQFDPSLVRCAKMICARDGMGWAL